MAGHYISLVDTDDIGKVTRIFEDAIAVSFVTHPMRNMTKAEVARRFRICDDIFGALRGDLKWSIPKIRDMLGVYLKCELDGVPYNPADMDRASWSPEAAVGSLDVAQGPDVVIVDHHGMPLSESEVAALDASRASGDTVQEHPTAGTAGAHEE